MTASRRRLVLAGAATALLAGIATARAASAMRLLVAYPPGGVSDLVARGLAGQLGVALGERVVVENRPGAGGAVALASLAAAPADGRTLAFSAIAPLTLLPRLRRLPFDPLRDIAPVAGVMFTPALVLGTRALGGATFEALLREARQRPAGIRWASSGFGTTGHMIGELVRRASGARIVHVPYKGGGQQLNDALAGEFEVLSSNVGTQQLQHVRAGRLAALAVGAPARVPSLPQVPTLGEAGFPEANVGSVFAVFAPGATPAARREALATAIEHALRHPSIREPLLAADNTPLSGGPSALAGRIAQERSAWVAALAARPPR